MDASKALLTLFFVSTLVYKASCGEFCQDGTYCENGCCGSYYNEYCCAENYAGLIAGLVVGFGTLVFIIIIIYCICRRRRLQRGIVYRNTGGVVVSTSVVSNQVTTNNMQPGVVYPGAPNAAYPPAGQPYPPAGQPYPPAGQPYPPAGLPYQAAGQPYPAAAAPPNPPSYAQAPPPYDSLQYDPNFPKAGVANPGYTQ